MSPLADEKEPASKDLAIVAPTLSASSASSRASRAPIAPGAPRARGGVVVVGVLVAVAISVAFFLGRASPFEVRLPPPTIERIEVKPSPNVIVAVRDFHRLESTSFHMERVVELTDKQSRLYGLVETKDAILLVAVGDVVAGVDLDAMKDTDVEVDWAAKRARLRLPAPQIFAATIDNQKTHVYERTTDLLASRKEELEGLARADAESSMRQAAVDGGILERARASAGRSLESLVRGLGFTDVTVEWQDR